ncbi:MAG: sodium:proton antiporter NhaD [Saprospiraceae bacterium]|nr:sodium:proton antiporter NhaD [Saprospiraceae bacterium]
MLTAIIASFIIGYVAIAFEHPLKLDKTVPALLMGAVMWAFVSLGHIDVIYVEDNEYYTLPPDGNYYDWMLKVLLHHLGKIAEILFFLIGAMTIVELVDLHKGFSVITNRIRTTNKKKMLVLVSILAFLLSAILDNLTTTIVLVSLLRRLVPDKNERIWYASMVIIAANAGGAFSPIGDVTTTMLWIGKKVSTLHLLENLVVPSVVCLVVPMIILMFKKEFQGNLSVPSNRNFDEAVKSEGLLSSGTMLMVGVGSLIFVPVFKGLTHLPPYMGMILGLGVTWLVSEYIHPEEDFPEERKKMYSAHTALSRIEMSSILFFLGILLAVAALESVIVINAAGDPVGLLHHLAEMLQEAIPNQDLVIILIGVFSAIIDNVPLVAATMGMYSEPMDAELWHFIAYAAGTGGSMLIIGSAAGVAAMGMERIDFIWYLKKIAWLAAAGFLAGALVFIGWYQLLN